jgi:hypothetical protein
MTVGFISPALRRGSPTDLTVRADRATLSDAAVEFDAADKALLKTASDPAFFTLAGKTVSIWVKLDDSDDRLIFKQDENTLRYDPNEDAFIWDYNGFEDSYQTADGTDLTDWVHIVIVARSAGVKIYLNGIIDTNDDSEIPVTGGDGNLYQFGGQLNGVWFDGKFDSSAIWEREFTDAEVLELYNDGDGFTYSQLPANLATGIMHAWDFSARSSTGVWFDAVGGANLTEEFDATSSATKLDLVTGITAGLARAYGTDVGDSVSLWLDRSGEGNDLAQTSIVSQPMLVEVDGVNWLRFDGVDDILAMSPALDTTERTVVVVNEHGVFITEHNGGFANIDTWGIKGFLLRGGRLRQILIADRVLTSTEKARIKQRFPVSGVSSLSNLSNWLRACNITSVDKDFLQYTPNATSLSSFIRSNNLTSIDKDFLQHTPLVTNVNAFFQSNNLTSIDKDFLQHTPLITTARDFLSGNNLTSIDKDFLQHTPLLNDLAAFLTNNNLTSIDPDFLQYRTTVTSMVSMLNGNALDQASVDGFLVKLESYGTSNGFIGINGGTNATPSATGQTATDALRARGWTVALNGY